MGSFVVGRETVKGKGEGKGDRGFVEGGNFDGGRGRVERIESFFRF